ncbi:hypothetical protein BCR44DRAFT_1382640, partial [Catenaria anguillulae PL171]
LYGDSAYALGPTIEKRAMNDLDAGLEHDLNVANSGSRVAVEWYFGRVLEHWGLLSLRRRHRILQSPVASWYRSACFLTNVINCLYPNQISTAFMCDPPILDDYL